MRLTFQFIEEIKQSFLTELVEFRLRFSNCSRVVLTNHSLISGRFSYLATLVPGVQIYAITKR